MSEITQLLNEALDPRTTASAEARLNAMRDAQPVVYVTALADHMAAEDLPEAPRQFAGVMLAQTLEARDPTRRRALQQTWTMAIPAEAREHVKAKVLAALGSPVRNVFRQAAQVVAAIATIELPMKAWPGLVSMLASSVAGAPGKPAATPHAREAALLALGYVCEEVAEVDMNAIPSDDATEILKAIYAGMASTEPEIAVRRAGTVALLNALEFVHANFEDENARNMLMQSLCECASFQDEDLQLAAYECLVRVAQLYYEKLKVYMHALFQLTLGAINGANERVAMQGIEFWTTIADEENNIFLEEMEYEGRERGPQDPPARPCENYTLGALEHLLPALLESLKKHQDDTPGDDVWDLATSSATCIAHVAMCVGTPIVRPVMVFVETNMGSEDWHAREAAIAAFGAILEGPEDEALGELVKQGVPIMIHKVKDPHPYVQDSAIWALSRISEHFPDVVVGEAALLHETLTTAVTLLSHPSIRVASLACWTISPIAESFPADGGVGDPEPTNALSPYYSPLLVELLKVTERPDASEGQLQTAVYETLSTLVTAAAADQGEAVMSLLTYLMGQLNASVEGRGAGGKGQREALARTQGLICSVMQVLTQKLGRDIVPNAPAMMGLYGHVLTGSQSGVHEEALVAVSNLALVLEKDFAPYLPAFMNVLSTALASADSSQVCSAAVAVVVDLCHAVGQLIEPYCDAIVEILLNNLKNQDLEQDIRPPILSCFGDIAFAIGGAFEKYAQVVMSMLQQASLTDGDASDPDVADYLSALRAGCFQAYSGILHGLDNGGRAELFMPHVQGIGAFLGRVLASGGDQDADVASAGAALLGDMLYVLKGHVHPLFQTPEVARFLAACNASPSERVVEKIGWVNKLIVEQGGST